MRSHRHPLGLSLGLGVTVLLLTLGSAAAEMGVVGQIDPATGKGEVKLAAEVRRFECDPRQAASLRTGQKVEVDVKSATLVLPGGRAKCKLIAQASSPRQPQVARCPEPNTSTPSCLTMAAPTTPPGPPGQMAPGVAVNETCFLPPVGNPGYPGQCASLRTACPSGTGYTFAYVGCCMGAFGNPTSGPVYARVTCKRTQ